MIPPRVFLLSPARADGVRIKMLLRPQAQFELARKLRQHQLTLGEAFEFASGLYFRGKRAYARAFARTPPGLPGALVIAPGAGLVPEDTRVSSAQLAQLGEVPVDEADRRFTDPLLASCKLIDGALGPSAEIVLLGSIASQKYLTPLFSIFGARLLFPPDFVGRGDMSRGGLLLRCVRAGAELPYAKVEGAVRHGPRPPRLPRIR